MLNHKIDFLAVTEIVNKLINYFSHHGSPKQVDIDKVSGAVGEETIRFGLPETLKI